MPKGVLYTRYEHGCQPVLVEPDPVRSGQYLFQLGPVEGLSSKPLVFPSARQLLITVTGHPEARHWTFDRYFKTGRHTPPLLTVCPTIGVAELLQLDSGLTVAPSVLSRRLGIDLERRGHEVAKLLFAGFGHQIFAAGYDADDVLQEVYKGILARNRGRCPWDAHKSSFGHYVYMVCRCVVSNYARKQRRIRSVEQVGLRDWQDGRLVDVDVATAAQDRVGVGAKADDALSPMQVEEDFRVFLLERHDHDTADGQLAEHILSLVHAGHTRAEIATLMGMNRAAVSRGLAYIRHNAKLWAAAAAAPSHRI